VIKEDFYKLCEDFHQLEINLECIHDSYITLVLKKQSPETINEYRPISLLNISLKLLTKLLAESLQQYITKLIHLNKYGFIRIRTIQDLLW